MKKTILLAVFLLVVLLAVCGCTNDRRVTAIEIKDYTVDQVVEMQVGDFDYAKYTLVVTYASGETEEIAMTEDMFSAQDRMLFFKEGEHTVNVTYAKVSAQMKIAVKRHVFTDLTLPESITFLYDGTEHKVEVDGELPARARVSYPNGNTFINAGIYDVVAVVSCDGYVTERLSTKVTVERASHDMSGIELVSEEFVYDGTPHMLSILGTLPEGISKPIFSIDGKVVENVTDAGIYNVRVSFPNLDANYHPVPDMEATLTIKKAAHNVGNIELLLLDDKGNVIQNNKKVYDGEKADIVLSKDSKLPKGVTVTYTLKEGDGEEGMPLSALSLKDAGKYTVTAYFKFSDSHNYEEIAPISTTFEIQKASYALSGINFDAEILTYDGREHSIILNGTLPEELTVSYEYYRDGVLLTDDAGKPVQSVSDAGRYTVKAVLNHSDPNYEELAPLSAILEVLQIEIDVSDLHFSGSGEHYYNGEPKFMELVGTVPEMVTLQYEYYQNNELVTDDAGNAVTFVTLPGEYVVHAKLTPKNGNYKTPAPIIANLTIHNARLNTDQVKIEDQGPFTYDGTAHAPTLSPLSAELVDKVEWDVTLYLIDGESKTVVAEAIEVGTYEFVVTLRSVLEYHEPTTKELSCRFKIETAGSGS